MWRLEVIENGVIVIKRVYKTIEDAIMAVGLRYADSTSSDITIHLGFVRKEQKER